MSRKTVKNLQEALRGIERDIAVREAELERVKYHARQLREMIAFYGAEANLESGDQGESALANAGTRMPRSEAKVVRNAIYDILKDSERPMHARDLLSRLTAGGISVAGKDPVNNVRSHLSHDTRFLPVGAGKWDLASRINRQAHSSTPIATHRDAFRVINLPSASDDSDKSLYMDSPPEEVRELEQWEEDLSLLADAERIEASADEDDLAEMPF